MNFSSHIDAVVTVAVQLVNTLTPGQSGGRAYLPPQDGALLATVTAALRLGSPTTRSVTADEAAEFAMISGALRPIFEAAATGCLDEAAGQVNALLKMTGARPELERHDGEAWHLHFHGAGDSIVTGWAAGCATGLAVVLGSDGRDRLGVCTADRCDRVYVDVSRNGTRQFCSTTCQNRIKAAAFRARRT